MRSLKDAIKKAFSDAGQNLPERPKPHESYKGNVQFSKPKRWNKAKLKRPESAVKPDKQLTNAGAPTVRRTVTKPNKGVLLPEPVPSVAKTKHVPKVSLKITGHPRCKVSLHSTKSRNPLVLNPDIGYRLQLNGGKADIAHDITIGLDFGTSSVKAVVGDASLGKYFAVPFMHGAGIDEYLLPSRLYVSQSEHVREYSLSSGDDVLRDLKLSLLADPGSLVCRVNIAAFLGLVLRHVRVWLFKEHADIYKRANIFWKVAIGLPSESRLNNEFVPVFEKLVAAAWTLSQTSGPINERTVFTAITSDDEVADLEISVIPELSAQIYGFVASPSSAFDKNKVNRYSIVDVGAGTVDASIFEVRFNKGRWDFFYYTPSVKPNGVANLHSHRVDWWVDQLQKHDGVANVVSELKSERYNTDIEIPIPEDCSIYVEGLDIIFDKGYLTPDEDFFKFRLVTQVQGQVLYQCWKMGLLSQQELTGMPMFVCGGGSRMHFYKNLTDGIGQTIGARWLQPEHWTLTIPSDLECPGVIVDDYDRLSVAYGLSRMDLGQIDIAKPLAEDDGVPPSSQDWRDRYIDKDQC